MSSPFSCVWANAITNSVNFETTLAFTPSIILLNHLRATEKCQTPQSHRGPWEASPLYCCALYSDFLWKVRRTFLRASCCVWPRRCRGHSGSPGCRGERSASRGLPDKQQAPYAHFRFGVVCISPLHRWPLEGRLYTFLNSKSFRAHNQKWNTVLRVVKKEKKRKLYRKNYEEEI